MAKKKLNLKVLFDTNVIFTATASDLLRQEITELVSTHSNLSDIHITWHLPDIVVKERIFQMTKKGLELISSIQKMERLLGHNLNITADIISSRVKENVIMQMKNLSIEVVPIDTWKFRLT
jgi:hypothetical protein